MNKSNIIAKRLDTFFKWSMRFIIVAMSLCIPILIISIVILNVDPNYTKELMNSFSFGNMEFYVTENAVPSTGFTVGFILMMLGFFLLCAGTLYVCLRLLRNILKPIIFEQPFHAAISVNLKKLGWTVVIFGVISACFSIIEPIVLYHGYNFEKLMLGDYITKITPQFTVDLGFILVAVVVFLLSHIFKYGAELQQQVDETL